MKGVNPKSQYLVHWWWEGEVSPTLKNEGVLGACQSPTLSRIEKGDEEYSYK